MQALEKLGLKSPSDAQVAVNMLYDQALLRIEQQPALARLAHALTVNPDTPKVMCAARALLELRKQPSILNRIYLKACFVNSQA